VNDKRDHAPASGGGDPWPSLRRLTAARIGLRRTGASLATSALLEFQLAHARARDAVHAPLDVARLADDLAVLGSPVLTLASAADDMQTYLMRPDLGRTPGAGAEEAVRQHTGACDLAIVVAGGLSARAVQDHAVPILTALMPDLKRDGWRMAPLMVVRHGRVAIGDRLTVLSGATMAMVLIGERPGLSAPDSMGAYLTYRPHDGTTDADRNCVSNIRPDGTGYADAAYKIAHLLRAMRARELSGVRLKDTSDRLIVAGAATPPLTGA
jgi:ethanolamine ammonia-lyase small subunit